MKRALIVHCSHTKKPIDRSKAIELYDGPTFKVIRNFFKHVSFEINDVDVYILSARYGLIDSIHVIDNYDLRMTSELAKELKETVMSKLDVIFNEGYSEVCIALSKNYLEVVEGYSFQVSTKTKITRIKASQGERLKRIKDWLYQKEDTDRKKGRDSEPEYKYLGKATLKRVKLSFTREEIIAIASEALENDNGKARNFKNWYSIINGNKVGTKWLVSILSGLPVTEFQASDARRVLGQLGVEVFYK